ncbi:unnamed protein product [Staurois parvus]|uniref:Uncharacterized protein n=1 Tax=Staurois parvus TaxID=386267 RepID=A0ABN9EYN1_9NEOB|nr:unnamed protein product [Staurois parvus]
MQGRVAVYKRPPPHPACASSLGACSTAIWCLLCPPDTVKHRSLDGTSVRDPDHVITD